MPFIAPIIFVVTMRRSFLLSANRSRSTSCPDFVSRHLAWGFARSARQIPSSANMANKNRRAFIAGSGTDALSPFERIHR